jgi:hypothetical protein
MLSLLLQTIEHPEGARSIRDLLFHAPSVVPIVDLLLTLGIIWVLWWYRHRIFSGGEMTPRQYERLTARLDSFERTLTEDRRHVDTRLDDLEMSSRRQVADDQDFRHKIIENEDQQLRTMGSINAHIASLVRRLDYTSSLLKQVQCVKADGSGVGDCVLDGGPKDE